MPVLELTAGFGQDPVADFHDQPELFEHRDEVAGRHQPAARMAPAQQGFRARQAFAVAAELRLVEEGELLLLQGVAQVAFQLQTLQRGRVHVGLIELEVVLAALFGVIHRRVGVLHQLTQFLAVLRAECDADTGGHKELAAFQHERRDQAGQNAFGDVNGAIQRRFTGFIRFQQQGEFITAHAGHGVIDRHTGEQPRGHFLQHPVARGMPQGVVDRFEAVEVEEHQHDPGLLALGVLQRRMQAILEQGAVGQVSQRVVVRQTVDTVLAGLAFADIAEEAHVAGQIAFVVEDCGNADPGRVVFAVTALEPDFTFPRALSVQLPENVAQAGFLFGFHGEHARQLIEHLSHFIATDAGKGLVGLHDIAGGVGNQDGGCRMLEYSGSHAQVFLGPTLLTDVPAHAEDALEIAVFAPHQHHAQFHRDLATVGTQAVEQEHSGGDFFAQPGEFLRFVEDLVDAAHERIKTDYLLGVGNRGGPAVLYDPLGAVAQRTFYRRADVVDCQPAVGGENHVTDAFGEHAVTLFAVTQRLAGRDLLGNILGNADDAGDPVFCVPGQCLFANVEAPPVALAVPKAQHALQ